MALDFDSKTAPRRPSELVALAKAVFDASDADESIWLEWKSTLDLATKHGIYHVAKAIIGFANRMPEAADPFVEGCGYLIVGVSPGELHGVDPIDVVELDKGLSPYLGEQDQPRWQPTYVTLTVGDITATVLMVTVDAPRSGDRIYCTWKELAGVPEGTIFVRGNGATRRNKGHDLEALSDRFRRGTQEIHVELQLADDAVVQPVDISEQAVRNWLETRRREAMASLVAWERRNAPRSVAATLQAEWAAREKVLSGMFNEAVTTEPEARTPQEYRLEVEAYVQQCAETWRAFLVPGASVHLSPVEPELINMLSANLAEVQVELYLPGDVHAVLPSSHAHVIDEIFLDMPQPPRPYGPKTKPLYAGYMPGTRSLRVSPVHLGYRARPEIDNGGSARITFPSVHLRPHQRRRLDPFVIVVPASEAPVLIGQWTATSTSMDGRLGGELNIRLSDEAVSLTTVLSDPARR